MPKSVRSQRDATTQSREIAAKYLEESLVDLHAAFHYHEDAFTAEELEAIAKYKKNVAVLIKRLRRRS